ncbi:NmrA/HSCARG family protein [Streptosporangium canum]|uniref:NmrA/HSCARG family protein n=1 Tax=Streptosporangium canum TaxID=324952 RepID=UPI0037B4B0CD
MPELEERAARYAEDFAMERHDGVPLLRMNTGDGPRESPAVRRAGRPTPCSSALEATPGGRPGLRPRASAVRNLIKESVMKDIVVVTGATGTQGGAAARELLAAGWRVRALVRDPRTARGRALADAGAEVVRGDMGDRASLDAALRGVHGVFSVQPTMGYPGTPPAFTVEDELRLGRNVADAAADAGVDHFVYASVGAADAGHGIRRWESKAELEAYARRLGLPITVLRPVRFMENQIDPRFGTRDGVMADVVFPDVPVQLIAGADIGAFAALAFTHPAQYVGRTLELAGDELTMTEIAQIMGEAVGRTITYRAVSREALLDKGHDALAGYEFANHAGGWHADIPALRERHPGLMDFRTWLEREGAAKYAARQPA